MSDFQPLAKLFACDYCGSSGGEACRSKERNRVAVHTARLRVVNEIYSVGFEDGQRDVVGAVDSGLDGYMQHLRDRYEGTAR